MQQQFTKHIKSLSKEELIKELQMLYTKFAPIKKYYEMELSANPQRVLADFKAKIKKSISKFTVKN